MQHVEFFHKDHFEKNYHRSYAPAGLDHFIDFFWETDFTHLWQLYPDGFSDALFPNIGYTYLINLGTPFVMQLGEKSFDMKTDGFLPRHTSLECFHQTGNQLFGIKFRISPIIFEKKINFSEYKGYIFPLAYLLERDIINRVKTVRSFQERVDLLINYYQEIVNKYSGSLRHVHVVREILDECFRKNKFDTSVEEFAKKYKVSIRTLQRYFEMTTGITSKKSLQIMRIRKATAHLATAPETFHFSLYGYYDHSHFYKHLKQFLQKKTINALQPHLKLLAGLHK
ncbi:MAG TPA: hypothetical protein VM012_05695 [Flavitalea sp.]|nr:hypothetical protein [Flavitalea sp.]